MFCFSYISDLASIPVTGGLSGNCLVDKRLKQLEDENQHLLKSLTGKILLIFILHEIIGVDLRFSKILSVVQVRDKQKILIIKLFFFFRIEKCK